MESYSLEGEDLILSRYFSGKRDKTTGFFVDVGAYHPTKYSNTYLFYSRGWRGINIDAMPGSMSLFSEMRPGDINLEYAVSSVKSIVDYFSFEEPALNSFNSSLSKDRQQRGCKLLNTAKISTMTLAEILDSHIPPGTTIDFMTVDTEGVDLDVLKSNDWDKYRPEVLVVECSSFKSNNVMNFSELENNDIYIYIMSLGYSPFAKTIDNVLFNRSLANEYRFNSELKEQKTVRKLIKSGMNDFEVMPATVNCIAAKDDKMMFTDGGLWTPQTQMLQSIYKWVVGSDLLPLNALSIDNNPDLDGILRTKWSGFTPIRAVYPDVDVQDLSQFADESFDLVYSHQVLEHIPKPWIAASEILRVTRKGGFGIHTTCAFNPRHGQPEFNDYYRFLPDGIAELFDGTTVLVKDEWGNRQAILYNVGIDDGYGALGGRRFSKVIGKHSDRLYPWHTWIIYQKK